jgi:hypothetical protein
MYKSAWHLDVSTKQTAQSIYPLETQPGTKGQFIDHRLAPVRNYTCNQNQSFRRQWEESGGLQDEPSGKTVAH